MSLSDAERLCQRAKEEKNISHTYEASKIFSRLYHSTSNTEDKTRVLISYISNIPEEGIDLLYRIRDGIQFISEESILEMLIQMLKIVCMDSSISDFERIQCALCLYNHKFMGECYPLFESLANDGKLNFDYRAECCRYLYSSRVEEYINKSKSIMLQLLDEELDSSKKYQMVSGFLSKKGVMCIFNSRRIDIAYDEKFVYPLLVKFFFDDKNTRRERCVCATSLLRISFLSEEEKLSIIEKLFSFGEDEDLDENVRADALDIISKSGTDEQRILALKKIKSIGKGNNTKANLYENSQNVHNKSIVKCGYEFIQRLITEQSNSNIDLTRFEVEFSKVLDKRSIHGEKRIKILSALQRIKIDGSLFTELEVSLIDILLRVWQKIKTYHLDKSENLYDKLLEELEEMSDTCASGHALRLANVFSIYEDNFKISWKDQIFSNLKGRMNAKIRNSSEEEKEILSVGMLPDSEDFEKYQLIVNRLLNEVKEEMEKEFVGEGYLFSSRFEEEFEKSKSKYLTV